MPRRACLDNMVQHSHELSHPVEWGDIELAKTGLDEESSLETDRFTEAG